MVSVPKDENPQDRRLSIDEIRLVADLRVMHAKVDELYQLVRSLKERHNEVSHLKARCENELLREVKTCDVQQWLDRIAKEDGLSRNPIKHIKNFVSGVFSFAIRQDYFDSGRANPVREVQIPKVKKGKETHAYTSTELVDMLTKIKEPARTMVAVAGFAGLGKSEIYALEWPNYTPARMDADGNLQMATLQVTASMWRGIRNEDAKTEKRLATIPVIGVLAKLLDAHHARSGKPTEGPIFRNGNGKPLCPDSAHRQFIRDVDGIEWHGWHAGRRGLSTVLYDLGVDAKTRQLILRHSNVATTENIYTKRVDRKVTNAMQQLEQSLGGFSLTFADCAPEKEHKVQ